MPMKRGWLAVLVSAALLSGCAGGGLSRGERDGVDYATAKYHAYVVTIGRPAFPLLVRWYVQASCRAAKQHYRIAHRTAFAAAFARRVHARGARELCLRGIRLS
jgi:hypothetical protein